MAETGKIEIDLIKLVDGTRLLRLTDPKSGMAIERKLNAVRPVREQQKQLHDIFRVAVARAQAGDDAAVT
ncbi:MAG: hypothetical protein M3372_05225 [Verrucomicrobiota bacterium]|jgi:hypothetical protein|nr:hypothetical protein [Chthoniobacterales bacterium]MDQ3314590.1 hypothetical protein [Verrucomicrobiota bacterium]MDQ3626510.1 hypothetical protein [Verrucomicrobiota bacterium]